MLSKPLLTKEECFAALASENVANGIAKHQVMSMDTLLQQSLPNIIAERPEIVADTTNSIHVIEINHVHIDKPVARTVGGFCDWIEPQSAKLTKHTYANPVIVDVIHRVYSINNSNKEITWETIDAQTIDKEIQALEDKRLGIISEPDTSFQGDGGSVSTKRGAASNKERPRRKRPVLDNEQREWRLTEERIYRQVNQFCIPTMVGSIGCRTRDSAPTGPNDRFDTPGYFIAKGVEKTIQTQRRLHNNRFYVFRAANTRWSWSGEIRACHPAKIRSTSTLKVNLRCGPNGTGVLKATVEMPYIEIGIPVLAICMALGFRNADHVAVCAATGGALSGLDSIKPGSVWDVHPVHTTRQWVLSLLSDDAHTLPDFTIMPRSKILQWIGEEGTKRKASGDRAKYAAHLMANEFLPQLGLNSSPETIARKGQYFAIMLAVMADVARGLAPQDDRDHAGNRQYETAGMLCGTLARQHYRNFRRKLASEIRRFAENSRFVGIPDLMNIKRMTDGFVYALSTGNWGLQKGGSTQTGVAQMLNRMNPMATKSHLRRTDTQLKREGKQAKIRQIHVSSYGQTCPAETPEGPACGLVEQMAQGVWISQGCAVDRLIRIICRLLRGVLLHLVDPGVATGEIARLPPPPSIRSSESKNLKPMVLDHEDSEWEALYAAQRASDQQFLCSSASTCKVMVNGILLGFVPDMKHAAHVLRLARRRRVIPFDVAVEENGQRDQLCVTAEAGGIRRPLFVLSPEGNLDHVRELYGKCVELPKDMFWKRLVQQGYVEYLSKHEEENTLVLSSPCTPVKLNAPLSDHTHCEIHPSFMLGIAASTIPFSDHNQAPRTSYFASMCKQTAGSPPPDMAYTNGMRLMYAQKPLVTTWGSLIHGTYDQPTGMNIWIAVSAAALNQEDSLILNEDSKSRGLFACAVTKTYNEDCQSGNGADSQHFERPSDCKLPRYGNVSKMNPQGYVNPGEAVHGGDAIIGRTMNVNDITCIKRNTVKQDQTTMLPNRDKWSEVNTVVRCVGRDDREMISMRTHTMRFLQTGDKLTSQHGQKGIVGCLRPARDMPYTEDGIIADALINPHAFPSRMTVGHLLETALGLACAHNGETADGTPFNGVSATDVEAELKALGFDSAGEQVMYDGESGKRISVLMFFGCTYYLRVKQMVEDKHHARAHGPVHILTQQPVEGRSKEGGFRVGDMERECLQAYGAANVTWDRLFQQSDYAEVPICTSCRMLAMPRAPVDQRYLIVGSNELAGFCHVCKHPGSVVNVPMPFATKLWHFELMAYHVRVEHSLDPRPDINPFTTAAVGMRKKDLLEEENLLRPEFKESAWMRRNNKKRSRPQDMEFSVDAVPDGFMDIASDERVFDFGVDALDSD